MKPSIMKKFLYLFIALVLVLGCDKPTATVKVSGVTISQPSLSLFVGDEAKLTAAVSPSDAEDPSVEWTSSAPSVATVAEGLVKAISKGQAIISVKTRDGGFTAECAVTVEEEIKVISVTGVSLDKTSLEMVVDDKAKLTATVSPSDATNKNVSWRSSDESVATVTGGEITALKPGKATITVVTEDGGFKAECAVSVKDKTHPVTGVALDKNDLTLTIGSTATLSATVSPEDATDKSVSWKSTDETVVKVEDGQLTAVGEGVADVTVTTVDGGYTATCKVTVNDADNVIGYTTSDGEPVYVNLPESLGVLVSNTYVDNIGFLIFEDDVTAIGERAFQAATTLTSITIPSTVTSIGDGAFMGCSSLKSIDIPSSLTSVGESAFSGCISLEKFTGPFATSDGRCLVRDGELIAFAPYGLTAFSVPEGITSIGKSVFSGCESLTTLSLPEGLQTIGQSAFKDCPSLSSITIPSGVEKIPTSAFSGCTSLSEVNIPSSVKTLDRYAFQNCRALSRIVLNEGVSVIGDDCFRSCTSLTIVDLPSTVTRVGNNCFQDCSTLYSVTVRALTPPVLGGSAFRNVPVYCNFNVPEEALEAYKASAWNNYNGRLYPIK